VFDDFPKTFNDDCLGEKSLVVILKSLLDIRARNVSEERVFIWIQKWQNNEIQQSDEDKELDNDNLRIAN
jgi:hypothetical protein